MPARIPPGKEGEYELDERTGEMAHKGYGTDPEMDGTVLPTARMYQDKRGACPSLRNVFDAYGLGIEQNIVDTSDGHEVKARVTRGDMVKQQRTQVRAAHAPPPPPATLSPAVMQLMADAEARGLMGTKPTAKKKAKKKTAKRRSTKRAQPVEPPVEEEELQERMREEVAPPAWTPAMVRIGGPFGVVTQPFSGVFRDGMCLVLITNNLEGGPKYELPPITDDPIMLQIGWENQTVEAVWAGIQFTLPNGSVTFTVLLIPEDTQDDQGFEGQPGPQLL
jgi:hypothetical protein